MTHRDSTDDSTDREGRFHLWLAAAIAAFGAVGTVDWLLAVVSSTGPAPAGVAAGWVLFVGIWVVGAALWATATAAAAWTAAGITSPIPWFDGLARVFRRWYSERRDASSDVPRLATWLAAVCGIAIFATANINLTTYLIETREVAWLIATFSFVAAIAVAAAALVAAMAIRRLLEAMLSAIRHDGRCPWLNTPVVLGAAVLITIIAAITLCATVGYDVYANVEGPALTLVAVAVVAHPVAAHLAGRRLDVSPLVRRTFWLVPLAAVLLGTVASQQSEARRILVLHGQAAHFAFNQLHRHIDVDRVFGHGDCAPVGVDGLPTDKTPVDEFDAQCFDARWDRPTARTEIPAYDRPELDGPPSFVFVTWDSVRIERVGFMGHDRDTTPNLDAFAEEAVLFERAFTQDSGTGPSFWSLMAGKTPFQVDLEHGHRFPPPIKRGEPMLGELLEEAGYRNVGIMCGTLFDRDYWGIRWGFERFDNVCGSERNLVAPTVTEQSIAALDELKDSDEPFFLWVHYFDPHYPYNDHPDIDWGTGRLDRYDQELRYTDRHFGEFLDALEKFQSHDARPVYTIFGADHGENFGEHGAAPHARNLYRNVTHVPKVVRGPGVTSRRVDAPVAFGDVYPTVLDLAGVDIPAESTMVSQAPVFFGAEPDRGRMVFQENSFSRPRRHTRAVVYGRYQLIMDLTTHTRELYDYVDDPLQRNNLAGTGLDEERIMKQALIRFLRTTEVPEGLED